MSKRIDKLKMWLKNNGKGSALNATVLVLFKNAIDEKQMRYRVIRECKKAIRKIERRSGLKKVGNEWSFIPKDGIFPSYLGMKISFAKAYNVQNTQG